MKSRKYRCTASAPLLAVALAVSGVAFAASGTNHAKPGAGKPHGHDRDPRTSPRRSSSGSSTPRRCRRRGFKVKLKGNIGSSEIVDKALTSHQLDMYPEYTGTILSELAHQTKNPSNANDAYNKAKKFEQTRGFTLLNKTPFFDSDAIGVLKSYAPEEPAEVDRRPQEARQEVQGRRAARVPHPLHRARRAEAGLRRRADVRAARRDRARLHGDRQRQDQRRRRVHDRRAAGVGQVHAAQGPEVHLRLPERRAGRVAEGASRPRARRSPRRSTRSAPS